MIQENVTIMYPSRLPKFVGALMKNIQVSPPVTIEIPEDINIGTRSLS
ncbi:MAG: hypothetical protein HQ543_09785 [Bacteroidetes bacterium]|nr:hypothetical protein [Bacteroidota bacterium]